MDFYEYFDTVDKDSNVKCYKHFERYAVSQCIDCNQNLCIGCKENFKISICTDCMLKRISKRKLIFIVNIVSTIVAFIIGVVILRNEDSISKFIVGICSAGLIWGWKSTNKINLEKITNIPLIGIQIYLIIKIPLSMIIGIFVMPVNIFIRIKKFKKDQKIKSDIKSIYHNS